MAVLHPAVLLNVHPITDDREWNDIGTVGSSLLLEQPLLEGSGEAKQGYYLVTCWHVVKSVIEKSMKGPVIHLNLWQRHKTLRFPTEASQWWWNEEQDVAIYKMTGLMEVPGARDALKAFWTGPAGQLRRDMMDIADIWEGHPIFVLGFPKGRGVDEAQGHSPIVRSGIIAQIQPYLRNESETFLIDVSSHGGNSGGPVFTQPTQVSTTQEEGYGTSFLIGMLRGTVRNYRPEGWFDGKEIHYLEEESRLGVVIGVEAIYNCMVEAMAAQGQRLLPFGSEPEV